MDRQILNITANEQILTVDEPIRISTNKVNYIEAHFTLGDNWSGYDSVRAVWFNDFYCISTVLDSNGVAFVPSEVMKRNGKVKVNLVGSISENDVLTDRLTSYPVVAVIVDCTAQITGANTSPITPSEFEQFAQRVHTDAERAEQGASNAETSAQNASDSATSAHNSAESAHDDKIAIEEAIAEVIQQIEDFEQVQVVVNTLPPSSQATSDFTDGVLTLGIPQGVKGDTGNGIQSITKTGTSGLVDTYTITFTDGQTTTFNVTNGAKGDTGNGIQSIAKTSTVGLVDTYTITYTNGTTTTFTVTNGEKGDKGEQGESGGGAVGTVASAYSASKTYAVGDYVIHNSNLYRCTTAITTAESFNASHWTQVVLADDVTDLKSNFNGLIYNDLNLYHPNQNTDNYYYNPSGVLTYSDTWSVTALMPILPTKMYYSGITATGTNPRACYFDATKTFISAFLPVVSSNKTLLTPPTNAKYVAFSVIRTDKADFALATAPYENIYDSVDSANAQIEHIKADYASVYDVSSVSDGYYWNPSGVLTENASMTWSATDYMPIVNQTMFYVGVTATGTNPRTCYFDENKNFISSIVPDYDAYDVTTPHELPVPNGAKYVTFSLYRTDKSLFNIYYYPLQVIDEKIERISSDVDLCEKGFDNTIYSWWVYPLANRYEGIRDKTYIGYTDNNGYQGVMSVDNNTGVINRKVLRKGTVDDHNAVSVSVLDDGKILCVLADHGTTDYNHIYISKEAESVRDFESEVKLSLPSGYSETTYAQVLKLNNKWYMFWRCKNESNWFWGLRTSDDGVVWTEATIFLTGGSIQYYMLARPYDGTRIKLYMTSNPALDASDIRLGFIDTSNGNILNSDMSTVLGNLSSINSPLSYSLFNIIVDKGSYHQRLFDVGIGEDLSVLWCQISGANYNTYYSRYDNGVWTPYVLPSQGGAFGPNYQNGGCFIARDKFVLCKNNTVDWSVVKYEYNNGSLDAETLATSPSGDIKMMRPIKCVNDNSVYVNRGLYNPNEYTDFLTNIFKATYTE